MGAPSDGSLVLKRFELCNIITFYYKFAVFGDHGEHLSLLCSPICSEQPFRLNIHPAQAPVEKGRLRFYAAHMERQMGFIDE